MTTRRALATLPVIALAGFLSLLDPDQDAAFDPQTTAQTTAQSTTESTAQSTTVAAER